MKLDTVLRPVRDDLDNVLTSTFKLFDRPDILNYIINQPDFDNYLTLYNSLSLAQYWYYKRNELKIKKEFNS